MLDALDQQAGTAGDDGGGNLGMEGVLDGLLHGLQVLGIHDDDVLVAVGLENVLDPQSLGDLALEVEAGTGIVLVAGHAGDGVIQHHGDQIAVIIDDFGSAGHAAVEEGGIAENAEDLLVGDAGGLEGLGHTHGNGEAAAHADHGVQRVQRGRAAQRVAADVAGNHEVLMLGHGVEEASVGAAGAQCRGTGNRLNAHVGDGGSLAEDPLLDELGVQLIHVADELLADAGNAGSLDLFFHEAVQLFDNVELLHLGGEVPDQIHGKGVGQTQLQEGGSLGEGVLGVVVGDGGRDDADLAVAQLHLVQGAGAAVGFQLLQVLLQLGMVAVGVGGSGDVLAGVAHIGGGLMLHALAEGDNALGVGHAGGGTIQHRHVELLGDLVGCLHEIQAFLRIGGLHHGDLGGLGVIAVVLLVLGGVHAGVVGGDDDKAAADAVVGSGENGVGRHVDAHMLHGAKAADTGNAGAVGNLCGHLFVGSPLAVKGILVLGQILKNLRAGGAGIGGADLHAGLVGSSGNGLIAGKKFSIQCNNHLSDLLLRFVNNLQNNYIKRLANCKG